MAFAAADVPDRIDLLLNGEGYMFAEQEDVRANLGITATFVPRYTAQGDYGDNTQDFFLNTNHTDWSLGEGQKFYRRDEDRRRRFWESSSLDISVPGQASLGRTKDTVTATYRTLKSSPVGPTADRFATFNATNLYHHSDLGETSYGAHGLGTTPTAIAADGDNIYVSADTVSLVRKYDINGAAFSSFSTTQGARELSFLNNTMFGWDQGSQKLFYYDTAGAATTVFTFKDADGNAPLYGPRVGTLCPYGGKMMLMTHVSNGEGFLYVADTVGISTVAQLPAGFIPSSFHGLTVAYGAAFIAGEFVSLDGASRAGVLVYDNGSLDTLWRSSYTGSSSGAVAAFAGGLVFPEFGGRGAVFYYDLSSGSVSSLFEGMTLAATSVTGGYSQFHLTNATDGHFVFPSDTTLATSGYLTTSLDDFDSSLTKTFRGITVEYVAGSGGNLGSVDIAYRVDDVDGSYTTLQTSAVSGTEYALSSITGKSISVKVTINKGTSTTPPVLKRVKVRAIPKQAPYRKDTYVLSLGGRDGSGHSQLRDGTFHPSDGLTQATNLRSVAIAGAPVTVVDQFGSYTGVIDNENLQIRCFRPEEFVAVVPVREV